MSSYGHYPSDAIEIAVKVAPDIARQVERLAKERGLTRSAMASTLLVRGLASPPPQTARICAYRRCENVVVGNAQKRYCCPSHRKMANQEAR